MRALGVYFVLGLPNSTACTQDQYQLYQEFKCKTVAMTQEVFTKKLADRSKTIANLKAKLVGLGYLGDLSNLNSCQEATVDDGCDDEVVITESTEKITSEV